METHLKNKKLGAAWQCRFVLRVRISPEFGYARVIALKTWIGFMTAFTLFTAGSRAIGQDVSAANTNSSTNAATNTLTAAKNDSTAESTLEKKPLALRVGPFDLHPRLSAGMTYDDNLLLAVANREADTEWLIHPALQAVAGDDAALITYRDKNYDVLSLSPGGLIVQESEVWPGKLLIVDYGPGFQLFDKYTANNHIDQFGTLNLLWPMNKLILGLKQDYQSVKTEIIEFDQRATVETISTALSAGYQFGDATSIESDFRRVSVGYDQAGLTGYTEYNTEDWFNYRVGESLPVSIGVLAGWDDVSGHQDETYEQLRARARYSYTEKLTFDASAGGELREYENGKGDTLSPVFTVAGEYRPAVRTTLRVTGLRQQYASIYNGYNYATTGASLELRQGITERFIAAVSAGYYDLEFTSTRGGLTQFTPTRGGLTPYNYSGDYIIPRISLEAKILRHLDGQIYYQFLGIHEQTTGSINDDQVGVQLTLHY
jgi:hypothetical protein